VEFEADHEDDKAVGYFEQESEAVEFQQGFGSERFEEPQQLAQSELIDCLFPHFQVARAEIPPGQRRKGGRVL
jgi:hypothetical protein